jgi:D-alanyl-D-alanine carboxypeptidase/D-alanyl-D-alanine-endopeptidase (penicillin-binding protein 4)
MMGTSKNPYFRGPLKIAQMQGSRKPATGAYTEVREDRGCSGERRRWAVFRGLLMSNKYKTIISVSAAFVATLIAQVACARVDLQQALDSPGFDPDRTSIVVADASTGEVLASHLPDLMLNPASCAKILTSVTALAKLGLDYRFTTSFYANRRPQGSEIDTLYVEGTGDPFLINEEIARIASVLRNMGIVRINGGIVIDNSYFDSFDFPRKYGDEGRAFTAKTSAVTVNFNSIGIEISPGSRAGSPAKVELKPPVDSFDVKNRVKTGSKSYISIAMGTDSKDNDIVVSGRIHPRSGTQIYWRSVPDPVQYAGAVIKHIFGENGISVTGPARSGTVPNSAFLLTKESSPPLSEIVRNMNKLSTNFVAEQLTKHLGAVFKGPPGSTTKGVAVIEDFLASIGIPQGSVVLENGSGLSSISKISARQLTKVLVAAYRNRTIRSDFMSSLSVLGIDGTMKKWKHMEPGLTGMVYAKTGTLNAVSALAGYVPMSDGRMAAFAILANGLPKGSWAANKAQLAVVKSIAEGGR